LSVNDLSGVIEGCVVEGGGAIKRSSGGNGSGRTSILLGTAAADTDQQDCDNSSTSNPLGRVGWGTIDGGIDINVIRAILSIKDNIVIAHEVTIKDDGVGKRGRDVAFT